MLELSPESASLIEQQPSTNGKEQPKKDDVVAKSNNETFSSNSMGSSHIGISGYVEFQLNPLLASPSPLSVFPLSSNPVSYHATPVLSADRCGSCGSTVARVMDYPHSDSSDSDRSMDADRRPFCPWPKSAGLDLSQESTLYQYGPGCNSSQDSAAQSLQRDQALLAEYIRNDITLTSQLAFLKNQRKKKHTDSNLVRGYRFMISLHTALKEMELKEGPRRRVSSRAILACLDLTPSWLSRAKKVVKLLDKLGPEGTSPDPLVIKRLQSEEVTCKGSDLLTFLKRQDRQNALISGATV